MLVFDGHGESEGRAGWVWRISFSAGDGRNEKGRSWRIVKSGTVGGRAADGARTAIKHQPIGREILAAMFDASVRFYHILLNESVSTQTTIRLKHVRMMGAEI